MLGAFDRSFKIYKNIVHFESYTGNGGGDPDTNSNEEQLEIRLKGARETGKDVGALRVKTIEKWYRMGWYTLFNDQCATLFPAFLCVY